ncbi:50S ribosomal protein L19 [Leptospira sp. GIMC2001]|uniref:50S ribosomal protein L19 n=1 Tax=Leptospira sp. GIMC2001 TaxID=1513297 RepID=UPI00234BD066|nr:50S ribosomal protein L19 [Leptospira sp. GIMC2001]WCL47924.1 50S ribosomal protein L19 [Leptospira sp. GIMC2001]
MNQLIEKAIAEDPRNEINFEIGDTVKVHYKIVESGKERIQGYEGLVIAIYNKSYGKTFTVRRVSYDVGVERIFPIHSPKIQRIELVRKGKVRRAKLYYVRGKSGKAARIKEKKGGQAIVARDRKVHDDKVKAAQVRAKEDAAAQAAETPTA